MELLDDMPSEIDITRDESKARDLARGVVRLLADLGYRSLTEFSLKNKRRTDVIGLDKRGNIIIVEIKSGPADFRSDTKWREYLDFCDKFYFAVADDFPRDMLPADQGLIIADRYGGEIVAEGELRKVNAARRKTLTLNFARTAASRLNQLADPEAR
jgi:hypothetical protein